MKKFIALIFCVALMLCMCACASIFSADHYESYPFVENASEPEDREKEIKNYAALKAAILDLVENHSEQGFFRFGNYRGSLVDDLAAVCVEIKTEDPLGAYAVEDISYDTSRIVSYYTCEISIDYKKTAGEIRAVESVSGLGEFGAHVRGMMEQYSTRSVVRVYSSVINEDYIVRLVEDFFYADPTLTVTEPRAWVKAYPASGAERIYEISLDYGLDTQTLLSLRSELNERLENLCLEIGDGDELSLALACASRLSAPADEQNECLYPGTAYGALLEGGDDSFGLALAYKALCDRFGINCFVVLGEYKADSVEEHAWNIVSIDGEYYHVDISRFQSRAFLLSDEDIWGDYFWLQEDYPECAGSLRPEDVFGPLPEEMPGNGIQPDPEPEPEPEPSPDQPSGEVENN